MALVAGTLAAAPLPVSAQWHAEARVGQFDFRLGEQSAAATTSVGLGVAYEASAGWFRLSAGVPTGAEDPLWGAAETGGRLDTNAGPVTLGVDVAAQGFLQRYTRQLEHPGGVLQPPTVTEGTATGFGVALQALPFAAAHAGPVTLRAQGGWSGYRSGLEDTDLTRHVALAGIELTGQPTGSVLVGASARRYWADDTEYTLAGGSLMWAHPSVTLWATAGRWLEPADHPLSWSAGAQVPVGRRLELALQARDDSFDPLYASAPRRSWTLGVRVRLGDVPSTAAPVPASYERGVATIALPASSARGVPRIAGDFTDWQPVPMTRDGDTWSYQAALAPGVYEYAFVDGNGTWFVPPSTPGRRDDGMGGFVALLVVGGES